MGTTVFIDIMGSMLIGGLLLLVALRMNDQATKNTFQSQEQLTVQQNMVSLVQTIESDFRKMGFNSNPNVPFNQGTYIQFCDTSDIKFQADLGDTGTYNVVEWKLGPVLNKFYDGKDTVRIKELDRIVDGKTFTSNLGVTRFFMNCYASVDSQRQGKIIALPVNSGNTIQLVQLIVNLVPTAAYDTAYSTNLSQWKQTRLTSMNLARGR